ncbi:hypothetical protein BGZ76_011168 [Entomortierella beljakovae]|nr:hypothetical protein BGZ76_011168 [Entomortierella beljakovae]
MSDKKGNYYPVLTEEENQSNNNNDQLLTQAFQPPPYTPSAPNSPFIQSNQVSSAAGSSTGLYPQLYDPNPQQTYQPTHQHPKFDDPSKPLLAPQQHHQHQHQHHQQQQHQQPSVMASPLILMRPPSRIEDLKSQPGVVVCQHCHYVVLTEATPESGSCTYLSILGLFMAGVTSCGCCLLPLCMTSCKDIMHTCPGCHEDIGLYSRLKEKTFPVRDMEDSSPPSYEEAIAHIDTDSHHQRPHQHHSQPSHSNGVSNSHSFNLNEEIQNSHDEDEDNEFDAQKTTIHQVPDAPGQQTFTQPSAPPDSSYGLRHRQPNSEHQHQHDHRSTAEPSAPGASMGSTQPITAAEDPISGSSPGPDFQFPNNPFMMAPGNFGFPGYGGFRPPGFGPTDGFGFPPGSGPVPMGPFPRPLPLPNSGFPFQTPPLPNSGFPFQRPPPLPATSTGAPFIYRPPPSSSFLFPPTPQPPSIPSPSSIPSASDIATSRDVDSQSSIQSEYTAEKGEQLSPIQRNMELSEHIASSIPGKLESKSTKQPSAPSLPSNTTEEEVASGSSSSFDFSNMLPIPVSAPLTSTTNVHGLMSAHDISTALYTRTKLGVESIDPLLNDPYQLYRFLVAHNDRPSMHILITEKRNTEERSSDGTVRVIQQKVKVDDFKMDFDLTPYISPTGTLIAMPDPKTGRQLTLREVMEEYAEDENPFKELHIEKKVIWDYENLTRAITHAIRKVNYRYTVEISYPITNNRVAVLSSSPLANFMRSNWTKMFCFMSFIGIIAYPLREIYKVVKDKPVKSEFNMTVSIHDFFNANYWNIVDQVQYK